MNSLVYIDPCLVQDWKRGMGHAWIAWERFELGLRVYDLKRVFMSVVSIHECRTGQLKDTRKAEMSYQLLSCLVLFRIESDVSAF
jgi:hypothetical protein